MLVLHPLWFEDQKLEDSGVGLTPAEAEAILKHVYIEKGRQFTKQEALQLINTEVCKTIVKKSKQHFGLQAPSMLPETATKHTITRPNFVHNTETNSGKGWKKKRPRTKCRITANLITIREEPIEEATAIENPTVYHINHWDHTYARPREELQRPTEEDQITPTAEEEREEEEADNEQLPTEKESPNLATGGDVQREWRTQQEQVPIDNDDNQPSRMKRLTLPLIKIAEKALRSGYVDPTDFRKIQDQDDEICHYVANTKKTKTAQGIIMKQNKIYVPGILVPHLIDATHLYGPNLHTPESVAKRIILTKYYRQGLKERIEEAYQECFICTYAQPDRLPQPPLREAIRTFVPPSRT